MAKPIAPPMLHQWAKLLATTDAEQPTRGWPVRFLRFTRSGNPHNVWTWFRNTVFAGETWAAGTFGRSNVETVRVDVRVRFPGFAGNGVRRLRVTHDQNRQLNNKTPNTWVHYDGQIIGFLRSNDMSGRWAVFEKDSGGNYYLTIQSSRPSWHGTR